jgi:tetratricopeptide (TPR) repeat protein
MIKKITYIIAVLIFASQLIVAGDLSDALKFIDNGNLAKAKEILNRMIKENPSSSDALLLDAIMTTDAGKALEKFKYIYDNNPAFRYADLCLFRIYSYNYAIGNYKTAKRYLERLKSEFPNSPYSSAEGELPKISENSGKVKNFGQSSKSLYTIQLGAFTNEANAKNLSNKLNQSGFDSKLNKKIVKGTIFNVVTVGIFNSRQSAEKTSVRIKKTFHLNPRITKIPD